MNKKFTRLTAALALLACLAIPLGMWGQTTYEQLTSIDNIDENAQYVLGIDGTGFHYSGTSSWGLTALPSAQTPIYYTLTKASDGSYFTAQATISGTTYYLQVPTSNTFSMATSTGTNTSLIIGTTQVSGTNYAVANKNTTTRHLRINGASGLRSYAGTTGTMAFFYKVVVPSGNTYTVTYHSNVTGNDNTVAVEYNEGDDVTVAANTFSNPGYAFTEWNTAAGGDGESYSPGDEIEDIDDNIDLYAQWEVSSETTYDFTQIDGFSTWGNGYSDHVVEYSDATVTFYAASHQTGTITDRPVTKAGPVILVMTDESTLNGVTFVLTQWTNKTKTVELHYSTDGGDHYTSTDITSSNFTITCNSLPEGTNAVKITFSETSNQVGIASATIVKNNVSDPRTPTTTSITVPDEFNTDIYVNTTAGTLTASVYAGSTLLDGATVTWASSNTAVATVENGAVTLVGVGNANITADYAGDDDYKPSQGIYQLTVTSSEPVPGTLARPYTVAEARAAIDAGTGLTDVYATGIISQVDSYSSQYHSITYWISADGTTTSDQLEVYSGKGLNNSNFSSVNDVEVGATVVIYGTLKKYGDVYEFDKNNYLVSYVAPVVAVEAPVFSLAQGGYATTQTVEITCATENSTIYYTTDGTDPTNASTAYPAEGIEVSETTTIKAIAYVGEEHSTVAVATYYILSTDNVYTVTEALAFNEYPVNNIFVSGIVSTAPTSLLDGGKLTYSISFDGEATDQLKVYKGSGLANVAFTAVDNIQVGDEVTIFGNVKIYNSETEFDNGNYLVTFNRPVAPVEPSITLSSYSISATAEETTAALDITYEYLTISSVSDFAIQYYDAEGEEIDEPGWISAEVNEKVISKDDPTYEVTYVIGENDGDARTTFFKVFAMDDETNLVYSDLVTVNQAKYVADYAMLPFAFDGGKADIENTVGLTQNGIDNTDYSSSPKLKFKTEGCYLILKINETPGELTFDIKGNGMSGSYEFSVMTSKDGITYETNTSYTSISGSTESKTINNLASDVRYIKWVYTTKDQGNVGLGNIALAAYVAPGNSAPVWSELPTPTIAVNAEYELDLSTYVTGTPTPTITLTTSVSSNLYEFEDGLLMFQPTAAGTYEFTFTATNSEGNASATLTVTAAEVATYTLATSITSGRHYVIAATTPNVTKAMGGKNATKDYYDAIDASIDGNTITVPANSEIQEFVIVGPNVDGYYYIYDPVAGGYLYASSSSSNDLSYQTPNDDNGLWEIDFTENTVTAKGTNTHNLLRYNSGNPRFSCYTSGQTAIAFYEKNETTPQYDFYKDIVGYGSTDGNYYLIASPIDDADPIAAGMITDELGAQATPETSTYDLYWFDQTQDAEWQNYRQVTFNLVSGMGYLYANKENETIHFTGTPYDGDGSVSLVKDDEAQLKGWNLIGNPFAENATIDMENFYIMNEGGSGIVVAGQNQQTIAPMQGIFVQATEDGQTVTFTPVESDVIDINPSITAEVSNGRSSVIDRAIVRFGNGSTLPKFQLNANSTKLYITEGNQDFAVVRSAAQGEMPVSFKAENNGTYTISVNAENVEMTYLHLIDNMTGADVDLLATPSYSFEARTTDYASRFRLVFNANNGSNENGNETFAYYNGSEWMINNMGDATLQVVDVMGRVLSTETVSGNATINLNQTPGVYMFRLVNGDSVKVQKVVVR